MTSIFRNKYTRLEILFFFVYYILFSVMSDIEFNWMEKGNMAPTWHVLPERLYYGLSAMLPGLIFYKLLIQRFLFEKKYIQFVIALPIFLLALNLYMNYNYLLVSKLSFLPQEITAQAAKWHNSSVIMRFSVIYMFREFLVLTALAYFIRSGKQDLRISQMSEQQLQAELTHLKSQIQPHFFFNTLNNIYALTLQQSEKAAPLVAKHSDIMRYMLYKAEAPLVPLKEEIDFLSNYIAVEAVRYSEHIQIDIEVQGLQGVQSVSNAGNSEPFIAPLILLPFIENTFKHGISEEVNEGFVSVIISLVDKELSLEVKNSKVLTQSASNANLQTSGIGLKNVKKRLELLYPKRYHLEIHDEADTFTVFLTLQLQTQ